jgi:hypothetical protein
MCTWIKLQPLDGSPAFAMFNAHLDNMSGRSARDVGALMHEKIQSLASGMGVVVTGDFNTDAGTTPYKLLLAGDQLGIPQLLYDAFRVANPKVRGDEGTRHDFQGKRGGDRIDWILANTGFTPVSATINHTRAFMGYPSDHFPVEAILRPRQRGGSMVARSSNHAINFDNLKFHDCQRAIASDRMRDDQGRPRFRLCLLPRRDCALRAAARAASRLPAPRARAIPRKSRPHRLDPGRKISLRPRRPGQHLQARPRRSQITAPRKIIDRADYSTHVGDVQTMGLTLDRDGRMYLVEKRLRHERHAGDEPRHDLPIDVNQSRRPGRAEAVAQQDRHPLRRRRLPARRQLHRAGAGRDDLRQQRLAHRSR